MDEREIAALVGALAPVVKRHVEAAVSPLAARIKELEARAPEKGEPGPAGRDGTDGPTEMEVEVLVQRAVAALPAPRDGAPGLDGKDADAAAITAAVLESVMAKVAEIPVPKDGQNGADGRDGVDGKDADVEVITAAVTGKVMEVVKAIPVPKDGAPGADGRDGKDGVGLAGAMIDHEGHLVVTMTNGTVTPLANVVGADGKDGAPGKDGADGLGFEDMSVEMADDGRTIIHRWERGERQKESRLQLAVVLDRGVYTPEKDYQAGDGTTWGGSFWIAQRETKGDKPGEANDAWRLSVKRGRDGKDGVMKPPPVHTPVKVG